MMNQPMFSVIMCNYNNARYIKVAIDSVLRQTFQDWELSILDDCSTDNSMEIIREYQLKDSRIKVYQNEKNSGYGKSLYRNIQFSKGKYGAILDPDDALEENALQVVKETFEKHPNLVGTYSQMWYCNAELKPKEIFKNTRSIPKGMSYLELGNMAMTHFFCFDRQKFIDYGNIDTSFRNALDQDWYYKIEEIGEVKFIPVPLYYYRVSPTGLSQGLKKRYITSKDHLEIKKKAIKRRGIKESRLIKKIIKPTELEILYFQYRYLKEEKSFLYILPTIKLFFKKLSYKLQRI